MGQEDSNTSRQKQRSSYVFKVVREDFDDRGKRTSSVVVVAEPFKTSASELELAAYVKSELAKLEEIRRLSAGLSESGIAGTVPAKRFVLYIRDEALDLKSRPILILGTEQDTVEVWREKLVRRLKKDLKAVTPQLYQSMLYYIEARSWSFDDLSPRDARWREACASVHPYFFSDDWTEDERKGFVSRSFNSIKKGLERGRYKSKSFTRRRTKSSSSRKKKDATRRVRKVSRSHTTKS